MRGSRVPRSRVPGSWSHFYTMPMLFYQYMDLFLHVFHKFFSIFRYKWAKKYLEWSWSFAQKMKFSIKDFFSKCDQIHRKLRIWSHLLKKSFMEKFIFCAMHIFPIFQLSATDRTKIWCLNNRSLFYVHLECYCKFDINHCYSIMKESMFLLMQFFTYHDFKSFKNIDRYKQRCNYWEEEGKVSLPFFEKWKKWLILKCSYVPLPRKIPGCTPDK